MTVQLNQVVPNFRAQATANNTVQLADYQGHYVLLYFYPKDNTAGCTQQALFFREAYQQFVLHNVLIIGVSRDSVKSHDNFKAKYQLPFELLSDADEALCQLFDVIKMKTLYGKQVRGIERSSFLISPDGVLLQAWHKVNVKKHGEELLQTLMNLPNTQK
jgi:thioredoxin-dependent peroxiredoxin